MFNERNPRRQEVIYRLISMTLATRPETDQLRILSYITRIEQVVSRFYNEDDTIASNAVRCGEALKEEENFYWFSFRQIRQMSVFHATH